jgi:hypothetical protein
MSYWPPAPAAGRLSASRAASLAHGFEVIRGVTALDEQSMTGKIFINYRRDDSGGTAGRLHDRLARTFGLKNLFMDVDDIPPGVDFVNYLNSQVGACDIFLAIIGPHWLNAKDGHGHHRLDNPNDFVLVEITAALARNICVIPVLVDGAHLPNADKLPDVIKPLVRRNAVEVRNTQFGRDANALIRELREALEGPRSAARQRPFLASAAAWLGRLGRWRMMAPAGAMALLLVSWTGPHGMDLPSWVAWAQPAHAQAEQQGRAAADAEAKRKAAEAEQQRLAAEERRKQEEAEAQARSSSD